MRKLIYAAKKPSYTVTKLIYAQTKLIYDLINAWHDVTKPCPVPEIGVELRRKVKETEAEE